MRKTPANRAVSPDHFDACLAALGPFGPAPRLAVGVSGGPDSMALCLLLQDHVDRHGGEVMGLTVDHGLRQGSAEEAHQVGAWLSARGIDHHILTWTGGRPETGLQEKARIARYALMEDWCRTHSVLHLLIAHHLDDQAETIAMRQSRGSGPDGLAGMSTIVERQHMRILRPLLGVPRRSLKAFLTQEGQDWIEDPSNHDETFTRVALRKALEGQYPQAEEGVARGQARQALEGQVAEAAARHVRISRLGAASLERAALDAIEPPVRHRLMAGLCRVIGTKGYGPGETELATLFERLVKGRQGALGGTRWLLRQGQVHVVREVRHRSHREYVQTGEKVRWDDRFDVEVRNASTHKIYIGFLTAENLGEMRRLAPCLPDLGGSFDILGTIPVVFDQEDILAAPLVGYKRKVDDLDVVMRFHPSATLCTGPHALAKGGFPPKSSG